jgi:uncharacterized protein (DUF58 family)
MTDRIRVSERASLPWRRTPVVAIGVAGAALLVAAGLAFSRPDVVGIGLPLALASAWMLVRRPGTADLRVELRAQPGEGGKASEAHSEAGIDVDADWVQLAVEQDDGAQRLADVGVGPSVLIATTRLQHSGPMQLLSVTARCIAQDGAWATDESPRVGIRWNTPPRARHITRLPVAPRLSGLHGGHEGGRPGQGGDFRDIHPFAPGDELRRVDWRATARAARRPGELLVRRNNTLSDSSVVIVVDTVEDLGAVVAGWGSGDLDRSGVTSLDLAREAALSIATTAVGEGDRIAYHALSSGGRSIPSGGGARHLARVRDIIAATGPSTDGSPYRRSPLVPSGSIVFVLSTFFDGAAAQLATRWRAAGHAVVAVDVLPRSDVSRLTREQRIALRTVLAERSDILTEVRHAGIEVVSWVDPEVDVALRLAALRQRRMRAVRR